ESRDGARTFTQVTDFLAVRTWSDVPAGKGTGGVLDAAFVGGSSLVVGSGDLQVLGVDLSTGTLTELGSSLIRRAGSVTSVIAQPDALLIATNSTCKGDAGIFRSEDGGRSWKQVLASVPFDPRGAIAPSVPHELLVQFFRDVSTDRQAEIFAQHRVAR